jgi:hypothetical protein
MLQWAGICVVWDLKEIVMVQELDIWKAVRERRISTANEIADITSLAKEGFFARIVAFISGGAAASGVWNFSLLREAESETDPSKLQQALSDIMEITALPTDADIA